MKLKRKPFIQRVIAALIVLLMPTLINVVMKNVAKSSNNRFVNCWAAASDDSIELPDSGDDNTWQGSDDS